MSALECNINNIIQAHNIAYADQVKNASCDMTGTIKAQEQQRFIGYFINENMPDNRGIALWHGLGSGKTLTSIIASLQNDRPVVVIAPAALIGNFKKELGKMPAQTQPNVGQKRVRSINYEPIEDNVFAPGPGRTIRKDDPPHSPTSVVSAFIQGGDRGYSLSKNTRRKWRRLGRLPDKSRKTTAIKKSVNKGIWSYHFYSSNGDLNTTATGKYAQIFIKNSLIIIDESQLLISKIANAYHIGRGTYGNSGPFMALYNNFMANVQRLNLKIICLSGTPIINTPLELAVLFNMLKGTAIFNLDTFDADYSTEKTPYRYSYTTESNQVRAQHMRAILNNTKVANAETFISLIAGLVSYFGNISRLLPRVRLLEHTKCGFNNEGHPLFSIKECVMSDDQYHKIDRLRTLTSRERTEVAESRTQAQNTAVKEDKSVNQYLIGMKNISYDFATTIDDGNKYTLPTATQDGLFPDAQKIQARRTAIDEFYNTHLVTYKTMVEPAENNLIQSNEDMRKHSIKIYDICDHIERNKDKKHIIYCESKRVNVILARALRKYMGYRELVGTSKAPMLPDTFYYLFLTGKGGDDVTDTTPSAVENSAIDGITGIKKSTNIAFTEGQFRGNDVQKEVMIDLFNANPLDSKFNVIILNSAAAEGITLKKVNFVHLLQVPSNMSRLYQIIGRSIRNCTHSMLDHEDQYVTPILYLATHPSIPARENRDIVKYESIVQDNDQNIPYLQLLKQAAIDCTLNKPLPGNEGLRCHIQPANCTHTTRRVRRRIVNPAAMVTHASQRR